MATPILNNSQRKYALAQPAGWTPKMPRYTLRLPSEINSLAIAYIGIQGRHNHEIDPSAVAAVEKWTTANLNKPAIAERFSVLFGRDEPAARVYACYWVSRSGSGRQESGQGGAAEDMEKSLAALDLKGVLYSLPADVRDDVGLWAEWFVPDLTRFETNYSGDDYRPGLARWPGARQEAHDLTGYWGAARDRMRASAYDRLDCSEDSDSAANGSGSDAISLSSSEPERPAEPDFTKDTLRKYIRGSNTATIAHIRSGQYWEACPPEESDGYEQKLEPHLLNGLRDVLSHPAEKGDYGLRFVRNIPSELQEHVRKETCALGYFRSLKDLENWAKDCPSHHKIFGGALSHRKRFGDGYKMRTWHEICVLKPGEAKWEYVNCGPETGILPFVESQIVRDL